MDESTSLLRRYSKRPVIVGWLLAAVVLISFRQWHSRQGFGYVDAPLSPTSFSVPSSPSSLTYSLINFNGWEGSWLVSNQEIEVVIVPSISRIMQFRFRNATTPDASPIWIQTELNGQSPNPTSKDWMNFGGDKAWPGPQSQWGSTLSNRWWPPPATFDAQPYFEVTAHNDTIKLVSSVDPWTGLQSVRKLSLSGSAMTIETELIQATRPKMSGNYNVSAWTITQLKDPEKIYMLTKPGRKGQNYVVLEDLGPLQATGLPESLNESQVVCGDKEAVLVSLRRDRVRSHKIGSGRARTLVWAGIEVILEIESSFNKQDSFPDQGCHAEIWSNPDPLAYVELEFLGPYVKPRTLDANRRKVGEHNSLTSVYKLYQRRPERPIDGEVLEYLKCKQV